MSGHTPGKWRVCTLAHPEDRTVVVYGPTFSDPVATGIARAGIDASEAHANAALIASAPDLAEEVKQLRSDLANMSRTVADLIHDRHEARKALKVAQDRLADISSAVIAHEDAEFECGMYANIASPKYADLIESRKRLRSLLAAVQS